MMSCLIEVKIKRMFGEVAPELYSSAERAISYFGMQDLLKGGVLVGLSGGPDSVFLLCFLIEYRRRCSANFRIAACHVNHLIRADEATRDENFSRELADSLKVDFYLETYDVPKLADEWGCGTEEAARRVRYSAFDKTVAGLSDISSVALAHNASDNLETVIFNMMRGSGLNGICGISPVRGNIFRPLIHIPKEDILRALEASDIEYVTDSTNLSTDYTRNYIRHKVVPTLKELNSSPEGAVSKLTESLLSDNSYLLSVADAALSKMADRITNKGLLSLETPILNRVLNLMCRKKTGSALESRQIKELALLLENDNFSMSIGGGYSFVCERGICKVFSRTEQLKDKEVYFLSIGENKLDKYDATVSIEKIKTDILSNVYNFSIHAKIPSAIIKGDLCLRFRRDGDCIRFKGHTRRLKKVFNDRNIPKHDRDRIPLLCDSDGILWVPGYGVHDYESSLENCDTVRITLSFNKNNNTNSLTTACAR